MNVHEIVRRYLAGESINQLARASGRSQYAVTKALRERGVHLRPMADAVRLAVTRRASQDDLGARYLPTEEEIWGPLTAAVRERWDADDYAERGREGVRRTIRFASFRHNGRDCYAAKAM
jgi:hypothetical protein